MTGLKERVAERAAAHSKLTGAIGQALDAGEFVPCLGSPQPHLWTSEDSHALDVAAAACAYCPVLTACRRYIDQYPEAAGTWAGLVPAGRSKR